MPTENPTGSAASSKAPSTPDYATMVRGLGAQKTLQIMKGDPNPVPFILLALVVVIALIFAAVNSIEPARVWFEEGLRTLG